MPASAPVFIGTDGGATTSKVGAVWADGSTVSTQLLQRSTNAHLGPQAVVDSWADAVVAYLAQHDLTWQQVVRVGVAIPGPRRSAGVLERGPNLPESFVGFDVASAYQAALEARAGRTVPLVVGNDGNMGGVAEARRVRGEGSATVLLLAPGSGLGCAYIDRNGLPLEGDTLSGMEASHMPAPLHLLDARAYPCGCGRSWGCIELYTTLAGLPYLLAEALQRQPNHALAQSALSPQAQVLSLRELAQQGDPLAVALFDFQAKALGLHMASLAMALDPQFVVIGGGLMDEAATTAAFRTRYLQIVRDTAAPYLWPAQQARLQIVPAALGDLSQAIGAALVALYESGRE
jgi:glucokinase